MILNEHLERLEHVMVFWNIYVWALFQVAFWVTGIYNSTQWQDEIGKNYTGRVWHNRHNTMTGKNSVIEELIRLTEAKTSGK